MIARIDSKGKTIAIEQEVTIDELVKFLKFVAPEDWKSWKINTNVKFEITSAPIVIREREYPYPFPYTPTYPPYPNQPYWYASPTLCDNEGIIATTKAGTVIGQGFSTNGDVMLVDFQARG